MKIEYVADGSLDCPLIQIFGLNLSPVRKLLEAVNALSTQALREIQLHDLDGFEFLGGHQLVLRIGNSESVHEFERNQFEWVHTPQGWQQVAGLLEPFTNPDLRPSHQWLTDDADIDIVISNYERGGW